MIKIRLTRIGKKHQPSYRLVVTPKENPAKGQYLELLGTYNPLQNHVAFDSDKVMAWLNKGAQPSDRVARLLDKAGLKHKSIVVKQFIPKPKEEKATDEKPKKEEPVDSTDETTAETDETADATEPVEPVDQPVDEKTETAPETTTDSE